MVHLAGNPIVLGSRACQRCMVCGYGLVNDDLATMASPDGPVGPSFFAVGALVEVDECRGNRLASVVGDLPEDFKVDDLPINFCLATVEVG